MDTEKQIQIAIAPSKENPFVVIKKPRGLPSAPLFEGDECAFMQAAKLYPYLLEVSGKKAIEHGLVHRIDTETEGLLLIATTQGADAYINAFGLESKTMIKDSIDYMVVCSIFLLVSFFNNMFSGIHNARGDSRTPFEINAAGLFTNIILDPVLIFKYGMGVKGAAIATIIAQTVSLVMNFYVASKDEFIMSTPGIRCRQRSRSPAASCPRTRLFRCPAADRSNPPSSLRG